jgi:hypothetical protein
VSVTGNFTSITLLDPSNQHALQVNGITDREPTNVQMLYIAIAHADDKQTLLDAETRLDAAPGTPAVAHELPSVAIDADGAETWSGFFPQATAPQPPYQLHDKVLAFGVLVPKNGGAPFFWHEARTIESPDTPRSPR